MSWELSLLLHRNTLHPDLLFISVPVLNIAHNPLHFNGYLEETQHDERCDTATADLIVESFLAQKYVFGDTPVAFANNQHSISWLMNS